MFTFWFSLVFGTILYLLLIPLQSVQWSIPWEPWIMRSLAPLLILCLHATCCLFHFQTSYSSPSFWLVASLHNWYRIELRKVVHSCSLVPPTLTSLWTCNPTSSSSWKFDNWFIINLSNIYHFFLVDQSIILKASLPLSSEWHWTRPLSLNDVYGQWSGK